MGATDTLAASDDDPRQDKLVETVREMTGRHDVDHAFKVTGSAALAFLPLRLARNGGSAIQVNGAHGGGVVALPRLLWNKRYATPLYGGCAPSGDFPRLFEWVIRGDLELAGLVSREYRLEELDAAMDDMLAGRIAKGVVRLA